MMMMIDDNTLTCTGYSYDSVKEKLLHNVNNVTSWFEVNNIKVKPDKLNVDHFIIGDKVIMLPEISVKILRLPLDNN